MVGDPISDLIIRIKNAGMVRIKTIELPYSKLKFEVAKKLQSKGYISNVEKVGEGVSKKITLKVIYKDGISKITDVKRISKPGTRIYGGVSDIKKVKQGFGSLILSTPKGVLTGEEARKENVGGEILFSIW